MKTDIIYICIPIQIGRVAEWLGRGLQNLVQRFESARDLQNCIPDGQFLSSGFFILHPK